MTALTIEFARSRYRFEGLLPEQHALVADRFAALLCPDSLRPDVQVRVEQSSEPGQFLSKPIGPVEYQVAVEHGPDCVAVAGIGFSATIDRESLRAEMQTCLTDEWFLGAFENLFRVLTCYRLFAKDALVMHSAAFTDGERGFLFCGRSGAGKTTICSLADALHLGVLSDELNAVRPQDGSFVLEAMPFAGDFGGAPRLHPPLPLTGLLGLAHGSRARLDACSKAEAVSRIVASCPYVNADPFAVERLTSRVVELVERVSLRVLSFAKDTTFWNVLDHEYGSPHAALSR